MSTQDLVELGKLSAEAARLHGQWEEHWKNKKTKLIAKNAGEFTEHFQTNGFNVSSRTRLFRGGEQSELQATLGGVIVTLRIPDLDEQSVGAFVSYELIREVSSFEKKEAVIYARRKRDRESTDAPSAKEAEADALRRQIEVYEQLLADDGLFEVFYIVRDAGSEEITQEPKSHHSFIGAIEAAC
jgi:hypothetical protein